MQCTHKNDWRNSGGTKRREKERKLEKRREKRDKRLEKERK